MARAEVIFVGEVADVRPLSLQTRDGTIIKTRVTFRIHDPIFGTTSLLEAFDFLGGEQDGVEMRVAGMPRFAVGDRRMVFATRNRSINPIVGFTQGLLRIGRDAQGVDRVFTLESVPLASPETMGISPRAVAPAAPMPLSALRERVVRALVEARRR